MFQLPKDTHVTLPSVESWGNSMNILKDPPKSFYTRKKDKVSDNQQLTDWVDDSGDRICEMINVYTRGSNPMVSVSYQNSNGSTSVGGKNTQASLPYKVNVDGAFRPPIQTARDLLPLSRQPRAWTYAMSMPGFADYSKIIENPNKFRQVKEAITNVSVRPTATFKIQQTLNPNYDIKNYINDSKTYTATSNASSFNPNLMTNSEPCKGTRDTLEMNAVSNVSAIKGTDLINLLPSMGIKNLLEGNIQSNVSDNKIMVESNNMEPKVKQLLDGVVQSNVSAKGNINSTNMDPKVKQLLDGVVQSNVSKYVTSTIDSDVNFRKERYTHDIEHINRTSAPTSYQKTTIHDSKFDQNKYIQDVEHISAVSNMKGDNKYFVFEDDIDLEAKLQVYNVVSNVNDRTKYKNVQHENELQFDRNMPLSQAHTNIGRNHENSLNANSRDFNRLHQKVDAGSFDNQGIMPVYNTDRTAKVYDERTNLQKKAYQFFSDRYDTKINAVYS